MERNSNSISNHNMIGEGGGGEGGGVTMSSDFVLQWGSRKRLRCMKFQVKDRNDIHDPYPSGSGSQPSHRATMVRVDRRTSDRIKDHSPQPSYSKATGNNNNDSCGKTSNGVNQNNNGLVNIRRAASPCRRILRNSEGSLAMRGQSNGVMRGLASTEGVNNHHPGNGNNHKNSSNSNTNNNDNKNTTNGSASSDSKKGGGGGGSSSGSDAIPAVWPPKFVIALTTKEKEEDFMAIKGSKLPQRPKKRAKLIQRTLNLVSPGSWLSDLTLERYEVLEKKVSKKKPRGLRAMGNMDSDSE